MKVILGADPEVFISRAGRVTSAHGLIPGTKQAPFQVEGGAVQVDGIALEFNIEPAETYEEFQKNLDKVFSTLKEMVPDYDILPNAVVEIDKLFRSMVPEEALQIGCNADVNAYTEDLNETPDENTPIRAAGGHVHVSGFFDPSDDASQKWKKSLRLARLMDKYVGVYSLLWDKEDRRRKIYGRAGACRPKDYGVEYRTLSNAWIFKPELTRFVFDQTQRAVLAFKNGEDVVGDFYRSLINLSNRYHPFFDQDITAQRLKAA